MKTQYLLIAALALYLTGCSGSGAFSGTDSGSSTSSSAENGASSVVTNSPAFNALDMKSYISGGSYDGSLAIDLDKVKGTLILNLPLGVNPFIEVTSLEIPKLPGVQFYTYVSASGTDYLAISVPLKYILHGVTFLSPGQLPNGDRLPQVPGGELPTTAVTISSKNNVKLNLYLGVNVIGLYVESPYNPYVNLTLPIKNSAKTKVIGYFSTIAKKGTNQGGFFISAILPTDIAKILDDHFTGI
ncbi:MAG: hypothetical protein ACOYOK_11900 [Pseudobdellovibrionaceae bacterium]